MHVFRTKFSSLDDLKCGPDVMLAWLYALHLQSAVSQLISAYGGRDLTQHRVLSSASSSNVTLYSTFTILMPLNRIEKYNITLPFTHTVSHLTILAIPLMKTLTIIYLLDGGAVGSIAASEFHSP